MTWHVAFSPCLRLSIASVRRLKRALFTVLINQAVAAAASAVCLHSALTGLSHEHCFSQHPLPPLKTGLPAPAPPEAPVNLAPAPKAPTNDFCHTYNTLHPLIPSSPAVSRTNSRNSSSAPPFRALQQPASSGFSVISTCLHGLSSHRTDGGLGLDGTVPASNKAQHNSLITFCFPQKAPAKQNTLLAIQGGKKGGKKSKPKTSNQQLPSPFCRFVCSL